MAKRNVHGMVVDRIERGSFYVATSIGHWADVLTGLTFAGVRVRLDETTRAILEVVEVGDPIQVPTHRVVLVPKHAARRDRGPVEMVREEIPFDAADGNQ